MEELHKQFVKLGRERNRITYKLLALLPEIFKQEIYREHGCATIEEYAGKFAGLSPGVVKKALGLEKKLEDKPFLQAAIETQGVHKVAIVANLATPETDKALADKVENMSTGALQELSREIRGKKEGITIELDEEMRFMFLKLKKKLGVFSNKETLRQILKAQSENTTKITKGQENLAEKRDKKTKTCSRTVSVHQKRELGDHCVYPRCDDPAEIFHHRERFSKNQSHESVVPLCRYHHEFVHNGLIENEQDDPSKWRRKLSEAPTEQADLLYRKYRKASLL